MPLPVINFDPLVQSPSVRGITWSLKRTEQWKTIRQQAPTGRVVKVPQYNNPLYDWELKWNYVNNGWPGGIQQQQTLNGLYTDFQVLRSLYFQAKGSGNEFLYQPIDSVISNQVLAAPDANGNTEVVKTVGGYQIPFSALALTITNIQVLNNVLIITVSTSLSTLAANMCVQFSGVGTATFLNGVTIQVSSINSGSLTFEAPFTHANYAATADTGTATVVANVQPTYESVQSLLGASLSSLYVDGVLQSGTAYTLATPGVVAPYDGFVIEWTTAPAATSTITANFSYYYQSEFEDSLEYENFLPYLWKVASLKFQQVRLP